MSHVRGLKVFGAILLAGLVILGTSIVVTAKVIRSKAAVVSRPRETLQRTVGPLAKAAKPAVSSQGATSGITKATIDAVGQRKLRIHATAEVSDYGADQRYMWSIAVYAADNRTRSNPLFQVHDTEHPFAVPPGGNLSPTFDHMLDVPLPPGSYRVLVGLLEFPPQVHSRGLANVTNTDNFRGAGISKVVLLTE
jgi:hypothetical protein